MKLKQAGVLVVLLSLLVSIGTGCQPQVQPETQAEDTEGSVTVSEVPEFQPGIYTDDMGRQVEISEIPEKIVSFGPNITEILFALGLGEKVVGVSDFCDYPEAAKLKTKVGSAFNPSIEKVVDLEPDLVITVKHEQLNSELEALGIKFIILEPKDVSSIADSINLVGKVTGKVKEGEQLASDVENAIIQMATRVKNSPRVKVFFIVDATDPNNPWTAGPDSFIHDIINITGGENVAAALMGDWAQMSIEQIVDSDPDIIIIQTMSGGIPTVSKEVLEEHLVWKQTTAVKQGQIYFIDGDLVSRAGPRIVQGLEEMAKIIHPELFE